MSAIRVVFSTPTVTITSLWVWMFVLMPPTMIIQTSRQYIDARTSSTQILSCEELINFRASRSTPKKTAPSGQPLSRDDAVGIGEHTRPRVWFAAPRRECSLVWMDHLTVSRQ
jgi:hypothetical protein